MYISAWLYAVKEQSPLMRLEKNMNISDFLITMAQTAEVEQPGLFPFPFSLHLGFCCIALVFFVWRFIKEKLPYQLIMAVAIPLSLIIWISNSKTLFYGVGIAELVLIIAAFVTSIVFRAKEPVHENAEAVQETDSEEKE
ncbi:MAG: hypothetical protein K2O29_11080 [Ruminococcus sp.]|nr:hypothetical protein [Ruminococcus sp.]MDE6849620.1 hypothetical protein [Ruminococcus sp.]MDE7138973.1 hypothetical protein [Ruminococcus sp.]